MSVKLMSAVFASTYPRSASERLMLLALADHADETGHCYPGLRLLASKCGVEERAAIATIQRLERGSFIRVERKRGRVNHYFLHVGRAAVDATGASADSGAADGTGPGAEDDTGEVRPGAAEPSGTTNRNKNNNRGDPEAGAVVDASVIEAIDALRRRGVRSGVAEKLVREHGASRVRLAVTLYDEKRADGDVRGAGWLIEFVRNEWKPSAESGGGPTRTDNPKRLRAQAVNWLCENGHLESDFDLMFEAVGVADLSGQPHTTYRLKADKPAALKRER